MACACVVWRHSAYQPPTHRPHQRQQGRADGIIQTGSVLHCEVILSAKWYLTPPAPNWSAPPLENRIMRTWNRGPTAKYPTGFANQVCLSLAGPGLVLRQRVPCLCPCLPRDRGEDGLKMDLAQEGASAELWGDKPLWKLDSSILRTLSLTNVVAGPCQLLLTDLQLTIEESPCNLIRPGGRFHLLFIFKVASSVWSGTTGYIVICGN